ncbi:MAG: MFS transporter, partial [Nitriliruptoraceae bacterium]
MADVPTGGDVSNEGDHHTDAPKHGASQPVGEGTADESVEKPQPRKPVSAFAPLKVPVYRRIWAAFTVSATGTFIQLTAGPWVMQELTGSPLMVSLVTTALFFPRLVLSLPAGALADVIERRTIILFGQSLSAVAASAMAVLMFMGVLTPWVLLGLTFIIGIGNALSHPSFMSLVPELVPRPLMPQAITLNSAAANLARSMGPSLGGALVAVGLTHVAFGANAVSFLAVIGVVLAFKREPMPKRGAKRNLWRSTLVGIRYVRFTRSIRILIIYTAIFNMSSASLQALLPSFASVELGVGAGGFGLLFGLLGAGAVVGAGTRERVSFVLGRRMLPVTITSYGVMVIIVGFTRQATLAGALIFVSGMLWIWTATTFNSSVQVQAPRWVRGRVVSLYVVAQGMQPVGAFVAGAIAEVTGAGPAIVAMASISVVLGVLGFRLRLPVLGELSEPAPAPERSRPLSVMHAERVCGSPIVVLNSFRVDG